MEYISVREASKLWKIDTSRVGRLLREGRISGAQKIGKDWLIPANAVKPADKRNKDTKAVSKKIPFRFPLYINQPEYSYVPALSPEEILLRKAQLDFFSCSVKNSTKDFRKLFESSQNIYIRQMSLFFLCLISVCYNNGRDFEVYYTELQLSLAGDYQYKSEMDILKSWLFASVTLYKNAADSFQFNSDYDYSPSVYPIMAYLSFCSSEIIGHSGLICIRTDIYSIEAEQLKKSGYYFESLMIHLALFIANYMEMKEETAMIHLRKAVGLAYAHNFIYPIADAFPYYRSVFDKVLKEYPHEFSDKVKRCGLCIYKSFSAFAENKNITSIFSLISSNDFKYILYASEGYTNKEIAGMTHISERTVAQRYSEIYDKLGIHSKQELINMLIPRTLSLRS